MKHVTFSDKSLLMDDETADLLLQYAVELARRGEADTVSVHALGADGNEVEAQFLLDSGTVLMSESAHTDLAAPLDPAAVATLRERLAAIRRGPVARPLSAEDREAMRSGPASEEL